MDQDCKKVRGGVRAGTINVTWPLATLLVSSDGLQIEAPFISVMLNSDQVIGLVKHRGAFSDGYLICHNSSQNPIPLIFWGDCDTIDQVIKSVGFVCRGIGPLERHISEAQTQKKFSLFVLLIGLIPAILMLIYVLFS